jgi:hypothetical protein
MRALSGVIVTVCGILIVLYAYLWRLATVALIVFMGIVVWLIHYFFISPWYPKRKTTR